MPPKVYLESPGHGDFRAMPARGDGLAMLKWISSFPGNPAHGLPTVMGVVVLSDATTSAPVALLDARSVTALRTGAVAAVASRALAREDAETAGIMGCGLHGAWAARCLAAAGYGPGVCSDPRAEVAQALADELGWEAGDRDAALACDVVCCVTPGAEPVVDVGDLRPGLHLNMLGADGPGKAEATVAAVIACSLFCDEWAQASHGGELTAAVEQGVVTRDVVTDLGAVLAGERRGPPARRRGDPLRLDRPGHPGPRHRRRGIRRLARGAVRGDDRRVVSASGYILRSAATSYISTEVRWPMPSPGGLMAFSVSSPLRMSASVSKRLMAMERPPSGSISSSNPFAGSPSGGPEAASALIPSAAERIVSASAPSHFATRAYIAGSSSSR